ncbi:MAG TPA: cytochrome c biogenesis protein CcsA [Terriglobales bacterium]|nr:cytochrome c biogenesis protein CcsA [Terriglobales bacterium]
MATGTTQVRVQERPVKSGYGLVIGVGIATAFALIVTLLNVAKQGNLFNETNLLSAALIFFSASAALYIGFGVSGNERHVKVASVMSILGFLATTGAAGHRWYVAGHAPFASIYEMLLSFVWTLALLTQLAERKFGVKLIGSVTMPIAVVSVGLMHLLDSEVHPLVPALQSTWLHIHVTLAMLAYAACALSFALAMMFLIKDNMKTETFLALTSGISIAIYVGILTRFEKWGGLSVVAWDEASKSEMTLPDSKARLMVTIPELGWIFALALLAAAVPLALYVVAKLKKDGGFLTIANRAIFISLALQVFALAVFYLRTSNGMYPSLDVEGAFPTSLKASPFILSGLASGVFASLLYLMLYWRRTGLEEMLPTADVLDRVTYKTICIAFPLLTLMIAAGAYWANRTWGSYWSWDPKETWAAITWLVYAGYLHMRVTRGWRGRRAAYFAIIGFAVVMFTFFGVTYLLPGLHAYA